MWLRTEEEQEASGLRKGTRIPLDSSDRQTDSGAQDLTKLLGKPETPALTCAGRLQFHALIWVRLKSLTHTATLYAVLTNSHALSVASASGSLAFSCLNPCRQSRSHSRAGCTLAEILSGQRLAHARTSTCRPAEPLD